MVSFLLYICICLYIPLVVTILNWYTYSWYFHMVCYKYRLGR